MNARTLALDPEVTRLTFTAVSAAFESLGKIVAFLDENMNVVDACPAFRGVAGSPDIEGRPISHFVDIAPLTDCIRAGKRCEARCELLFGSIGSAMVSAAPLPEGAFEPHTRYVLSFQLPDEDFGSDLTPEEADRIRRALEENRWRRTATARALGISRATLWRRMRDFGLL